MTCARCERLERRGEPYPLRRVLELLSYSADVLLSEYNYDGTGHEEIREAQRIATSLAAALSAPELCDCHNYTNQVCDKCCAKGDGKDVPPKCEVCGDKGEIESAPYADGQVDKSPCPACGGGR